MNHRLPVRLLEVIVACGLIAACGGDNSGSSSSSATSSASAASTTTSGSTSAASTGSSTSSGTSNAQLCADRAALTTSIQALTSVDIVKTGTAGIQAALTPVKDNLAALKTSASAELQPQVKALEDAITSLETAIKNSTSGGGMAPVLTAGGAVAAAGTTLLGSLQSLKC